MGPWAYAALAIGFVLGTRGGKAALKNVLRGGIKVAYLAKEQCAEIVNEVKDYKDDLAAEIQRDRLDAEAESIKKHAEVAKDS